MAGPIVKYHDVDEQISDRTVTFDKVAYGVKRFIVGLAKKMLIANTLGAVADKIFTQPVENFDALTAWVGAIAYTLQLYYDFSGYSDMAIGLGSIFGFKFLENFNYPYISKSITEFWRRWHISLSTWFKEYLYIPLGGNRVSKRRNLFNLFVVFLATGVWHGASWNFIFWGLWHGAFIIFEKLTGSRGENFDSGTKASVGSLRQKEAVERAATHSERAVGFFNQCLEFDVIAQEMQEALEALGEITGETVAEDILGDLFSRFCVGK